MIGEISHFLSLSAVLILSLVLIFNLFFFFSKAHPNQLTLSKGLDVKSKNNKKPKIIRLNINNVNFFKG